MDGDKKWVSILSQRLMSGVMELDVVYFGPIVGNVIESGSN